MTAVAFPSATVADRDRCHPAGQPVPVGNLASDIKRLTWDLRRVVNLSYHEPPIRVLCWPITLADGQRWHGPDHGTRVAERPDIATYWDLPEGTRPGGKPGIHLPWVECHKRGGKGRTFRREQRQMLGYSLGLRGDQ